MAEHSVLPMREEFPRWYRTVDIGENRNRLEARWKGVSAQVKVANYKSIETMLAVLLRSKSRPDAESLTSLRSHFKAADDLFEMSGNDRELEILCGTVLASVLGGNSDVAAYAALATSVAIFAGARKAEFPFDFDAAAEAAIARLSEKQRTRPTVPTLTAIGRSGLDKAALEKLTSEGPNAPNVIAGFNVLSVQMNSMAGEIAAKANAAINAIADFVAIQDEELQLLWWLFGGRSEHLNLPFAEISADAQPIILAAEIADATQFMPGPSSVKPILSRAGLKERKKTSVTGAINACDDNFLRKLLGNAQPSPVTRPLHFAIQRKLEAGDNAAWAANWSAVTGIAIDFAVPGIELGNLFYRERLGLKYGS